MEQDQKLGKFDVYCGIIAAILFADVIISNTACGTSVITWWILIGIFFFIPNGLITAELTGAYPDRGGIYGWIDKAFGPKWAARTMWIYFINVALWLPSSFIWFAGVFCDTFGINANYWVQVLISLAVTWIVMYLSCLKLSESKWIINVGAILKVVLFIVVFIGGVYYLATGHQAANELNASTLKPVLDEGLMFIPVIVYCCCGMEIIASNAHEMKNPAKDLPKAVMFVVLLTIIMNLLASWGVLQVLPMDGMDDLVTGLGDMVLTAFGSQAIFVIVMIMLMFTVFVQMITWCIGSARATAESAQGGELPEVLGKESKRSGAPIGALIATGIIATVVLIIYGFMANTASDLFYTLLAFSSILFFMPYLIMFMAYIKLKKVDPDTPHPFKAPCGNALAILAFVLLAAAIVLFVWVPGQPFDVGYGVPIIIGVVLCLVIGEIIVNRQMKKMGNN